MYIPPLFNFRFNILKQCYFLNKKKNILKNDRSIKEYIYMQIAKFLEKRGKGRSKDTSISHVCPVICR